MTQDKIKDKRSKPFFMTENRLIDEGHIKKLGAHGFGVYQCLVRHSNSEHQCFPSYNKINDETGFGKATISRSINLLISLGYIQRLEASTVKGTPAIYEILDLPTCSTQEPHLFHTGTAKEPTCSTQEQTCSTQDRTCSTVELKNTNRIIPIEKDQLNTLTDVSKNVKSDFFDADFQEISGYENQMPEPLKIQEINQEPVPVLALVKSQPKNGFTQEQFARFWAMVGKKVSKKKSEQIFYKIKNVDFEYLVESFCQQQKYKLEKDGTLDFMKDPDTWLRNECWNDQIPSHGSKSGVKMAIFRNNLEQKLSQRQKSW
jgi:hypothetical protein